MSQSFDYREPSILLLKCRDRTVDEVRQLVIGVDKEWRDGIHYWGEEGTFLLELEPSFTLLRSKRERGGKGKEMVRESKQELCDLFPFLGSEGAKLVSLNEKQRGFPTGLRFMPDTSYKDPPLLVVEPTLNTATYQENITLDIQHVEVRGGGGGEMTYVRVRCGVVVGKKLQNPSEDSESGKIKKE